jgi:hypothetical protein
MARAAKTTENNLLMPKATAVWLIENTMLTFKQIAEFTSMTEIEIEAIANEDIGYGIVGRDPIKHKELTQDELDRCQADPAACLKRTQSDLPTAKIRSKGPRYTPVSKRGDKPNAIAYVIKHNPEISDAQICKLVGTTKPTIKAIRERTHKDISNIRPQNPVDLGLCTYAEYDKAVDKGLRAQGKDPEIVKAERAGKALSEDTSSDSDEGQSGGGSGFDFSNFLGTSGS